MLSDVDKPQDRGLEAEVGMLGGDGTKARDGSSAEAYPKVSINLQPQAATAPFPHNCLSRRLLFAITNPNLLVARQCDPVRAYLTHPPTSYHRRRRRRRAHAYRDSSDPSPET